MMILVLVVQMKALLAHECVGRRGMMQLWDKGKMCKYGKKSEAVRECVWFIIAGSDRRKQRAQHNNTRLDITRYNSDESTCKTQLNWTA